MQIPFTRLQDQYRECKTEIDSAIQKILSTNEYVNGPTTEKFEKVWSQHVGAEDCASVGNGTLALILALLSCGVKPGQEVITTPYTFVSTVEAIKLVGAQPIFVDVDEYYHMDVSQIENKITNRTKVILFVDLYGQTPDISKLKTIAEKYNLVLIEDAAHSAGAEYKNKRVGGLVDLTCFSFNPLKNLGAIGDAGAVTGKKQWIEQIKKYRNHGRKSKYEYETVGYNARIDCIQAAVLLEKVNVYLDWNEQKRKRAQIYDQELNAVTPMIRQNCLHSYYVYVIQIPNRNSFVDYMKSKGISTNIHYKTSMNTHHPYYPYQSCPQSEWLADQIVSLPCYHSLTESEQSYVIEHTNKWVSKYS